MKIDHNNLEITEVIEIRLEQNVWKKIEQTRIRHKITYSWVTRLCLMRLFDKKNPKILANAKRFRYSIKMAKKHPIDNAKIHRHRLCLYGDDNIKIRVLATQWGVSMSAIVRLALDAYISLLTRSLSDHFLLFHGVKSIAHVVELHNNYKKVYFSKQQFRPFRPINFTFLF